MMNPVKICVLLLVVSLSGCKEKEFDFTLKGNVNDTTFSGKLTGATVTLEEFLSSGVTSSDDLIHTTTVAADGSYEFVFKRNKATKYVLSIQKENYFDIYDEISFSEFSTEEALVKNYSTTAKAWVKLIFINDNPDEFDQLKYTKQQGKASCTECCPITEQTITGVETHEILCVNDGNTFYSYYFEATNPAADGFMEINTPAFDTVELVKHW